MVRKYKNINSLLLLLVFILPLIIKLKGVMDKINAIF